MTEFLRSFDGVASRTIFCMWTGINPLPPPRMAGLLAMLDAVRCPLVFVTHRSLRDWEKSDAPFHPAFEHLSETHKADYLRCYLMHHFGGPCPENYALLQQNIGLNNASREARAASMFDHRTRRRQGPRCLPSCLPASPVECLTR